MTRSVFVNGEFVPFADAKVSVMDRGFLFADGIYEVSAVLQGRLIDNAAHLARLERSLGEIGIRNPYTPAEWERIQTELIARNGLTEGAVYWQVTRGVAERDFAYAEDLTPSVVMFTQAKSLLDSPLTSRGATVITVPDLRWARRDIKSIALLPQVLAKQAAARAGATEAWMVEDGDLVTEGASSTAFILTPDRRLITRPFTRSVLPGVTRQAVAALLAEADLVLEERAFTVAEAKAAQEAFYTSASSFVAPVVAIDGQAVGTGAVGKGKPGPVALALRRLYIERALAG